MEMQNPLMKMESAMLILAHVLRFKSSDAEIESLLKIADAHLSYPIHFSNFRFFKNFKKNNDVQKHYFCGEHHELITIRNDGSGKCKFCHTSCTKKELDHKSAYFLYLPLKPQLEELVKSDEFSTSRQHEDNRSDVINGSRYKKLRHDGIINKNDISIQFNTDGVKLFNRGVKSSIWPIQVLVNELPFVIRNNNVLLCGLWFNEMKPKMNLFLQPFVEELQQLYKGFYSTTVFSATPVLIRVHTILASLDSMARPEVQNMKQFNGEYGCSFCLNPGESIVGMRGKRIYVGGVAELRTREQHVTHATRALREGQCVKGVKGVSIVMELDNFSVVEDMPPDYLHAVLEGTMKSLFTAWFESTNCREPWYLGRHKAAIDEMLAEITPPCEITRVPRSVTCYKNWTASEWRTFLLYYSLAILKKFMRLKYYNHLFLFVMSIHLLNQEYVSEDDSFRAERHLGKFVDQVSELYNSKFMKYNIHLLLHIPYYVERFGALWSWSNFPFETYNGVIKLMFKGYQYVPDQILKAYQRIQILEKYGNVFENPEANVEAQKHFQTLTKKYNFSYSHERENSFCTYGAPKAHKLNSIDKMTIENSCKIELLTNDLTIYARFAIKNIRFHSFDYSGLTVRNNSVAQLVDGTFVQIRRLIDLNETHNLYIIFCQKYRVIDEMLCSHENFRSKDICSVVELSDSVIFEPVSRIKSKCCLIPYSDKFVIFPLINNLERD